MDWVFAYGSNMHLPDLARWLRAQGRPELRPSRVEPGCVPDYALAWNYRSQARDGGAANAVPRAGAVLHGVALEVDDDLLAALDRKEGHPTRYRRGPRPVQARLVAGGRVAAWLYTVTAAHVQPAPVPPRAAYLRLLIEAAETHGLDAGFLAELRDTPTLEGRAPQ